MAQQLQATVHRTLTTPPHSAERWRDWALHGGRQTLHQARRTNEWDRTVMTENETLIEETLRGGQMWSRVLRRGQRLRLTDLEGKASVAALLYNADRLSERYNMPDTLKAQQTAHLTQGFVLYSDMGRILCSVVADSVGWHDTITGHGTRESIRAKFGEGSY